MRAQVVKDHLVFTPVTQALPGMKVATIDGEEYGAVPFTVEAAQFLHNQGFDVQSPIETSYEWPGRFTPYKHQIHTAAFLTLNRRAFVLSGLGTGKTLSTLWAADYLMRQGIVQRCLILSPLSTIEQVWGRELFVNFPHRSYAVLHGARQKRFDLLAEQHDFYIVNHDGVEIIAEEINRRADIDLIVVDELAVFRNHKTKRWQSLKALTRDRQIWGLTGTPTPNAPTDAYAQMRLVKPENYTGSFTKFRMLSMHQVNAFRWIPRQGSEQLVNQLLKPAIRYALEDCIDLPETIYHERKAELSPEQQKHFTQLQRQAVTEIQGKEITAVNAAVLVSKLLQAVCGVIYSADGGKVKVDFGPRLAVLKECIEEAAAKVIVFVPFTGALDALYEELKHHWSCAVVDGGVNQGARNKIFNSFCTQKTPEVLIAHPQCMSHGLNLQVADTIIWYAPCFSNETYLQANARIVRPGQTKHTNIVHISATSVEKKIYQVLKEKGRLQDAVLDLV